MVNTYASRLNDDHDQSDTVLKEGVGENDGNHRIFDFSSSPTAKRLSRKLPPALTESLEQIALANPIIRPIRSYSLEVDTSVIPKDELPIRRISEPILSSNKYTDLPKPLTIKSKQPSPTNSDYSFDYATSTMSRIPPSLSMASTRPSDSTMSIATPNLSECDDRSCSISTFDTFNYEPLPRKKETRKEKSKRKAYEKKTFTIDTPPNLKALFDASLLEVIDEKGRKHRFGDLVRRRKTIVVFIRHWHCPMCAQYVDSILANVTEEALELAEVDLIIIGNGSDKMINGYRSGSIQSSLMRR
jgi:hypothetical protein